MLQSRAEASLDALGFNAAAANLRLIMTVSPLDGAGYGRALRLLDSGLARQPRSARLHALKGKALSNLSRYPEARRALRRASALDRSWALPRAWLGEAYLLENRVEAAAAELDAAVALDEGCGWAFFYRAAARYIMGRAQDARQDLGRLLAPGAPPEVEAAARAFLALLESKDGSAPAALLHLERAAALSPGPWSLVLRASVHRDRGDGAAALEDLGRALKAQGAGWVYLERALLLQAEGRWAEALRDVARAGRLDGPSLALCLRRAELRLALKRYGPAQRDLKAALRLGSAPQARAFGLQLLDVLEGAGRKGAAASVLRLLARRFPRDGEVLGVLAARRLAQLEERRRAAEERVALWEARARASAAAGRLAEAERLYRRVLPARRQAVFSLAEVLLRRGRLAPMRTVLQDALKAGAGKDTAGLVARFRLALLCDLEAAERLGERLLDRTSRFEDLDALYRPSLFDADRFAAEGVPEAFERERERALGARLRTRPDSPWAFYYYRIFASKLRRARPWADYEGCVERLKGFPLRRWGWMRYHIGLDCLYKRDFPGAVAQFEKALRHSRGGDWRSQCHIGEAYLCQGDLPGALDAFDAAHARDGGKHGGLISAWKGAVLLWAGAYPQALALLEAQSVPMALCWKGAALLKLGRPAEALEALDRAILAQPADLEARIWRGETLYRLGRLEEALAEAQAATRVGETRSNFYSWALRALIHGARGSREKQARDLARVPARVLAYARRQAGLAAEERTSQAALEAVFSLSLGVRRGNYETAIWMRP